MRIGIDLGGTKIEAIALDQWGLEIFRKRVPTPQGSYEGTISAITTLVEDAERSTSLSAPQIGIGIPGTLSPATGLVKNANSTWLNGKPLDKDLSHALNRPVHLANDANCLAVSEASDGAGAGAPCVLAVILGTGCGAGLAINRRSHQGQHGIAGELGHNPMPWMTAEEFPGPACWCGQTGCIETFISGTGFEADYQRVTGETLTAEAIMEARRQGEAAAIQAYGHYVDRLARALAMAVNMLDPDVIVLGGGMSNAYELYEDLPSLLNRHVFSDVCETSIRKAQHGDSSGVRGAAWLCGI